MTNHENLLNKTTRELAKWLDANGQFDGSPWMKWFDKNFCSKCESVKIKKENSKVVLGFDLLFVNETTCSYCELYKKCKYFQDRDETPTNVDIIEMWLKENI